MSRKKRVLIIDDDPLHLNIYGLIVEKSGYEAVPVLVTFDGPKLPAGEPVSLVLLDYRLNDALSACDIARQVNAAYPSVPIIILSDVYGMPSDIAPLVQGFVRKGEPEKLVSTLRDFLGPKIPVNNTVAPEATLQSDQAS